MSECSTVSGKSRGAIVGSKRISILIGFTRSHSDATVPDSALAHQELLSVRSC